MLRSQQPLRTISDLIETGLVSPGQADELERVASRYAVSITPEIAGLINGGSDPIARQFIPDPRELQHQPNERADPIADHPKSPVKGLVHRYRDRVLLKIVGVCPVYCRFCFRREMVGPDSGANLTSAEIEKALDYVRARPDIAEVIVTGGDPLVVSPRRIEELTAAISAIGHVRVIRWHSRVPVVAPGRVSGDLTRALSSTDRHVILALHANHASEMTPLARKALAGLADAGIRLISQSVLLKGINDDVASLEGLMRAFAEVEVRPYYLHHGDLAPGTSHFRTTLAQGQRLMQALSDRLPPELVPLYVLDIPGGHGKVPITAASAVLIDPNGTYSITDSTGRAHIYQDGSVGAPEWVNAA